MRECGKYVNMREYDWWSNYDAIPLRTARRVRTCELFACSLVAISMKDGSTTLLDLKSHARNTVYAIAMLHEQCVKPGVSTDHFSVCVIFNDSAYVSV